MNVNRLFWTVISLKPVQIYYQFRYRLFGYRSVKSAKCPDIRDDLNISHYALDMDDDYIDRFKVDELLNNRIWLLNEYEDWNKGIWEYPDRTHLWNFNLHYFEYGIALAASYRKTGDEAYYNKLVELYSDWHDTCFSKVSGDAWHPYTISLRLKNLLIIAGLLSKKSSDWVALVSQDIYDQYRFLAANPEKNLLGNHYFENLVTLYLCGMFFSEQDKLTVYRKLLIKEIKEQILPDGMHFERSFMYHNLILEDIIRTFSLSDGFYCVEALDVLLKMAACTEGFECNDRLPAFNDTGSNVAKTNLRLVRAVRDIVSLRRDPENVLSQAGYYRYDRAKWNLIVDAGDYAPEYISGHGHCDMLSLELYCDDEPILVNSGTYQYQSELRGYFRSTKAHNTLQVRGIEQSEIWGEHRTGRHAAIISTDVSDSMIAAKMRDYKGNILERKITIGDEVRIGDNASAEHISYWHIHPNNKVVRVNDRELHVETPKGRAVLLQIQDCDCSESDRQDGGSQYSGWQDISDECYYSAEFGKIQNLPSYMTNANEIKII